MSDAILEAIEKEVEKKTGEVLKENTSLKGKNTRLRSKNSLLTEENMVLKAENALFSKEKIRNERVESIIGFINKKEEKDGRNRNDFSHKMREIIKILEIPSSFDEKDGMDDTPDWFNLCVNHYEERETILDIFDFFGLEYPKWMRSFRLPHDYTKEEVLHYLKNMNKISNTNSTYFSGNIGFWFRSLRGNQGDIKKALKDSWNSMNLPWQFFLKNPNLLDDECFELVIKEMGKQDRNADQMVKLIAYQDLSIKQIERMLLAYKTDNGKGYTYDWKVKEKASHIKTHIDEIEDETLVDWFSTTETYKFSQSFPKKYHFQELDRLKDFKQKMAFINDDQKFTPREKQKMLLETVEEYHSDAIIAEYALAGGK